MPIQQPLTKIFAALEISAGYIYCDEGEMSTQEIGNRKTQKHYYSHRKQKGSTLKLSVPHSPKYSEIGHAADPTVMHTIKARFFTSPQA